MAVMYVSNLRCHSSHGIDGLPGLSRKGGEGRIPAASILLTVPWKTLVSGIREPPPGVDAPPTLAPLAGTLQDHSVPKHSRRCIVTVIFSSVCIDIPS
ncbi:hypothetical protein E2C01_053799 [Portunus trituberculatus]|uniref:Uncharacterized protein n=1 Tax=Portunus trituberculatus TaxID=210409 RepID=A0A5B7GI65_PORTR|nr:hypothetical protein [Portunus trituberculatus]